MTALPQYGTDFSQEKNPKRSTRIPNKSVFKRGSKGRKYYFFTARYNIKVKGITRIRMFLHEVVPESCICICMVSAESNEETEVIQKPLSCRVCLIE